MEKYVRKPNCNCTECSKEIYRRPSIIAVRPVFCSITCSNKRNKKDDILCTICGKIVPRQKRAKTCSRACANVSRTGTKYGLGRPRDKNAKVKNLKSRLLESRLPNCNRCPFDKIEILQVHHIIERCNGGTDDPNNLELLCPNCHYWHHYKTKTKIDK